MSEEKIGKREMVKSLIEEGAYTKKQIAEKLEMSLGSVSSQMTYLRWMKYNIIWDEDKVLSFCDEDTFNEWKASLSKGSTAKASKLSPKEQAEKLEKTIINQEKSLAKWEAKLEGAKEILEDEDSEENQDYVNECEANITLLEIKLKRNKAKAESLPDVGVDDVDDVDDTDLL